MGFEKLGATVATKAGCKLRSEAVKDGDFL
jgi:hypothetical protein